MRQTKTLDFLCPFAEYYLRYAVTSFFTISRISLAGGKRAGQKVHRKIAVAVQNVKPLYFLSRSFEIREQTVNNYTSGELSYSLCFSNQTDQGDEREGFEREGYRWKDRRWRD